MIDPNSLRVYITQNALKCGDIDVLNSRGEKVNPAVIEENKRIFENEIKIRKKRNKAAITTFSIFGVLLLLLSILIISDNLTDETAFLSIAFFTFITQIPTCICAFLQTNSLQKFKSNTCPRCYQINAWAHVRTNELGREHTTITKEVVNKHYAPDKKYRGSPLAEFMPQRYQGKSVTNVNVSATRYNYCDIYRCKCCGYFTKVNYSKVVED